MDRLLFLRFPIALLEWLAAAEAAIARAEDEAAEIEAQLADPATYQDADLAAKLAKAYQQKKDEIEELYARWEEMEAEQG